MPFHPFYLRIVTTLLLVLSIIFLPWWFFLPLMLAALIFIPLYVEALFLALFADALYGAPYAFRIAAPLFYTVVTIIFFVGVEYSRSRFGFLKVGR